MYLDNKIDLPLTLEDDALTVTKWWVDVSYAVHLDMQSHTGGSMLLVKGEVYCTFWNQKINIKSSTESEVDDNCLAIQRKINRSQRV